MTRTRTSILIAVVLMICIVAAGAVVLTWGAAPRARRATPRYAELPGGFDPLPAFDTTERELAFRGAECRPTSTDGETLHRECGAMGRQ